MLGISGITLRSKGLPSIIKGVVSRGESGRGDVGREVGGDNWELTRSSVDGPDKNFGKGEEGREDFRGKGGDFGSREGKGEDLGGEVGFMGRDRRVVGDLLVVIDGMVR